MQANQSQLIKLWPLSPHQTTRMNLQKTKKSGKIETKWWYSKKSGNIPARSPLQLLGSRLLHLSPTEKSAPQTFFRPPIFSLSICIPSPSFLCLLSDDPLMHHLLFFSFSPYIRISLSNSICFRESTFLSSTSLPFFKNHNPPFLSCRIFSSHMYAATLIPFSSQSISLTFLSAHTLVRV